MVVAFETGGRGLALAGVLSCPLGHWKKAGKTLVTQIALPACLHQGPMFLTAELGEYDLMQIPVPREGK